MTFAAFVALDVETTLNGNEDVGLAHPMHPDNRVVAYGMHCPGFAYERLTFYENYGGFCWHLVLLRDKEVFFAGHNIGFDLMYLYRDPVAKKLIQSKRIWDTQLAEYILTGQQTKFASLDELCKKYRLPLKDDKIKGYFQAGLGSEKIPKEELIPYLEDDVANTWNIAVQQYSLAVETKQLDLILTQMEALHATIEMMFNGLCIDGEKLDSYTVEVVQQYVDTKLALETLMVGTVVEDINSPKQWSTYFFGGTKKIKVKEEVGTYKNGNTKYKLVEKTLVVKRAVDYVPDPDKVSDKTGQVSVDDSVLKDMADHVVSTRIKEVISTLLQYRELSKQLSTYVQGLSKHILEFPKGKFIHGKLNHTATVTGRLSSTSPNLQNISNNPIKQIFVSRFGEDGVLVEMDFNQLEVVALAHVTRDKQLIADISSGTDIHSALYNAMFGRMPTKEERKPFKARTFQLIYGAGAKAISKQAGCSLDEAKKFIDVFYTRYPQVAEWHTSFADLVESSSGYYMGADGLRQKFKTCKHMTKTGRMFVFNEYYNDSAWSSKMYSFSPTELKNYPIQGLATGDIVPMMLGIIFRKLIGREDVKMVNTIHDSLMFDVRLESVGDFILSILEELKNTHKHFERIFKHPLALKLNAGASYGTNWFDMKEV